MSDLVIDMDVCPLTNVENYNMMNNTMKFVLEFDVPLNHAVLFKETLKEYLEKKS